jgi:predicted ATPase
MPQLHAGVRLTRLERGSGKQGDGAAALQDAYATFTEGLDTLDLEEARTILDEVGVRVA